MLNLFRCVVVALMLMPATSTAQDFDAGMMAYIAGDYATVLQEWRPLAEQGNVEAQYNLGRMYDAGKGVMQDHAEAVRLYRMASEQGNADAQFHLALMYHDGQGVPQDFVTAHMWYNIAATTKRINPIRERRSRDMVASRMTVASISEAQRRARVCMESGYQDCD